LAEKLKLLIITQRVDIEDDNLSFFHQWIIKLSSRVDKICVICLWEGKHNLPDNVSVYSLGKEKGFSKLRRLLRLQFSLLTNLAESGGIFIHMCPIYAIAAFPLALLFRKKMILWYAHARSSFLLGIAEKLVYVIMTPSDDSFVYPSKKVIVTGHGIDSDFFKPNPGIKKNDGKIRIITAGRINPSKDVKSLVYAADILVNEKKLHNLELRIFGAPIVEYEKKYFLELKEFVENKKLGNNVIFAGGIPNSELAKIYQESDIFVNMQKGGGAGKATLEAMACGTAIVVCTTAYNRWLGDFVKDVVFEDKNPRDLAEKIFNILNFPEIRKKQYSELLREIPVKNHNLNNLTDKIVNNFKTVNG